MAALFTTVCRAGVGAITACALLGGCSGTAPSDRSSSASPAPSFVNKVWRVESSNTVNPGQIYAFLSEGTLVITSPTGTPVLGTWKQEAEAFTMAEEGTAYSVEILELTEDRFRIRMKNPGEPVEMTLVLAAR
jgi:hypothetical protein